LFSLFFGSMKNIYARDFRAWTTPLRARMINLAAHRKPFWVQRRVEIARARQQYMFDTRRERVLQTYGSPLPQD
jgi:hypothetical protein